MPQGMQMGLPEVNMPSILPCIIYVGKLPLDVDDKILQTVFNFCGKVTKWNRPLDRKKNLRGFAYCTFEHGINALRCYRVLNGYEIGGSRIQIKAGSKQIAQLQSTEKHENNDLAKSGIATAPTVIRAAASNNNDLSLSLVSSELNHLDLAVKQSIETFLNTSLNDKSNQDAASALSSEILSSMPQQDGTSTIVIPPVQLLPRRTADDEEEYVDDRDQLVKSEIEQFRLRQAARDK